MKKYDIGIQTFWDVPNYGTFAQAYALQKVLEKMNPGRAVRQIAHIDQVHYNFYFNQKAYFRRFPFWKKNFWKSFFVKQPHSGKEQIFLDAYDLIPHTEKITLQNKEKYYFNKIFLGSDIIWDYSMEVFNFDPMLFGVGLEGEINAYAASFGTVCETAKIPQYVKDAIEKMKYISVRDQNSARIVQNITGISPEVVLDPAWLWDFKNDPNIVRPKEKNYILVYGQDFTPQFLENLIRYARSYRKAIIALDCNNDSYQWCDKLIGQAELHPFEWIGYFQFADSVATSTFHGITFSLIFHKPLAFCKTDFIMAKIDVFLKEIGLFNLYNNNPNDVSGMLNYKFDYAAISAVVDRKRQRSINFLKKACDQN